MTLEQKESLRNKACKLAEDEYPTPNVENRAMRDRRLLNISCLANDIFTAFDEVAASVKADSDEKFCKLLQEELNKSIENISRIADDIMDEDRPYAQGIRQGYRNVRGVMLDRIMDREKPPLNLCAQTKKEI